ncbi:hypothetical protein L0F63_001205, partial [Massospora cicadina]
TSNMAPPESYQQHLTTHSTSFDGKGEFRANDFRFVHTKEGREHFVTNYQPPNFSIKELRDAIPAHLFERSGIKSGLHTLLDLLICSSLFYIATHIDNLPILIQLVAWPTYWFMQGVFMTGLWVIAHECGHQAFSESKLLNNTVGMILHSALLVPYHSWRITHANHHAHTGHMTEDQVFVPTRRKDMPENLALHEALETSPIVAIFKIFRMLILGWPAYLIMNASGQVYPRYASHFHPSSPLFRPTQAPLIIQSDLGLITTLFAIGYFILQTSFWTVAKYYLIPYLFVNAWLVLITFLQHTDVYLPHYDPKAWNFVRGALTTVDRDFGWFLNGALHHINDSHVAHHLFSTMPFYNAIKATPYLKMKLGQYYLMDRTSIPVALYRGMTECCYVEDEGDVLFYKK